jgi:hypothetical protein
MPSGKSVCASDWLHIPLCSYVHLHGEGATTPKKPDDSALVAYYDVSKCARDSSRDGFSWLRTALLMAFLRKNLHCRSNGKYCALKVCSMHSTAIRRLVHRSSCYTHSDRCRLWGCGGSHFFRGGAIEVIVAGPQLFTSLAVSKFLCSNHSPGSHMHSR